jgi:hypothetical protein
MRILLLKCRHMLLALCLAAFVPSAFAACAVNDATLPNGLVAYPKMSDKYAVQYQVGGGGWTDAKVYISYYGETTASPYRSDSGYTVGKTSMSFVSIPAYANTLVQLRVTKLFGTPFQPSDRVSVRPSVKLIDVHTRNDGTVQISTATGASFAGEQFILWWNRGADGGGVESLAFFLNPPYTPPTGNVKTLTGKVDVNTDLSSFDSLDFERTVTIGNGAQTLPIPHNILNVFLGPDAWVQGKLRFDLQDLDSTGTRKTRSLYGPGVLDLSLFDYEKRVCAGDEEYYALSSNSANPNPDLNHYNIDGIVITDHNHAANDVFFNSTVNNMKTLGWNGENAALRLGDNTTASNLFIRSGDDSLMDWGTYVTVTNATVWQNYNGGVVNLGWSDNSHGDYNLIDGLYVVKTDWLIPKNQSWTANAPPGPPSPLNGQNNAVFASLMTPGTAYGQTHPPVFQNVFVEDSPRVLFSLKIVPPICAPTGLVCPKFHLTTSAVSLNIENLFTPASTLPNSIGFQNLPDGYTQDGQTISPAQTLSGKMKIGLTNVFVRLPIGIWLPLLNFDSVAVGNISSNGNDVNVVYGLGLP